MTLAQAICISPAASWAKAVLLIHVGAWRSMDRVRFNGIAQSLVGCGYAVFNIDYRLMPETAYPTCEMDCMAAARFLLLLVTRR